MLLLAPSKVLHDHKSHYFFYEISVNVSMLLLALPTYNHLTIQILMSALFQINAMGYATILMEASTIQAALTEKNMIQRNKNVSCQLSSII
jgi:hypothetical protein